MTNNGEVISKDAIIEACAQAEEFVSQHIERTNMRNMMLELYKSAFLSGYIYSENKNK